MKPKYRLADLPPEIRTRIIVNPWSGCWEWQFIRRGPCAPSWTRYGTLNSEPVHRITYKLLVGAIPEGLELDHVYARGCRAHSCCWPVHLEPVTRAENIWRGAQANIGRGVARTVEMRIVRGQVTDRERALADAAWMLPDPARMRPDAPVTPEEHRTPAVYQTEGAAEFLGVTVEELVEWRQTGGGPAYFRIGKRFMYGCGHLVAFAAERAA
jgi:hypothetical protein